MQPLATTNAIAFCRQPYATNLSDAEWDRIRGLLAPEAVANPRTRELINGIRYKQATRLRWEMLPPDLPSAKELQATPPGWRCDGVWTPKSEVAVQPVPRRFERLRQLKNRCVGKLRRTVGGRLVLACARPVRRLLLKVRRALREGGGTPDLPTLLNEAHRCLEQKQFAAAIDLYSQCLARDGSNAVAILHRSWAHFGCKQYREAAVDAWRLLALPDCSEHQRHCAYDTLAPSMVFLGDVERALGYRFFSVWLHRFGPRIEALYARDHYDEDAAGAEAIIEAHNFVAEGIINNFSDFDAGFSIFRDKARYQRAYLERHRAVAEHEKTLYLPADWVRNIGHMAYLDLWAKMIRLGWRSFERCILLAPPQATANQWYANYFRPFYTVVTDQRLLEVMSHFTEVLGDHVASLLSLPDGSDIYFCEGLGAIQEAWEAKGLPPLLSLSDDDRAFGREQLQAMGIPDGAWFVCLHVRSPGFHKEGDETHQAHRNADIRAYWPAILEIVSRGGWVIRMGDSSMPCLPQMPGVIDYAHGPHKSQRLDIVLCASCRFFVGVASGLSHIPTTFGVPCVMTNWCSNAFPVYSRQDLFLPKLEQADADARLLTFPEWFAPEMRRWSYSGYSLKKAGLSAIENTADELREVIVEMIDRLDGRATYSADDQARLARFNAIARKNGLIGFSQIGRDFLKRYAHLLDEAEGPIRQRSAA